MPADAGRNHATRSALPVDEEDNAVLIRSSSAATPNAFAWVLIARRIGRISACSAVVVRSRHRGTDSGCAHGGGASAYAPPTPRIGATIGPAVIMVAGDASAAMEASDASAATAKSAAAS